MEVTTFNLRGVEYPITNATDRMLTVAIASMKIDGSPATKAMAISQASPMVKFPEHLVRPPSEITEHPDGRFTCPTDFVFALDYEEVVEWFNRLIIAVLEHRIFRLKGLGDDLEAKNEIVRLRNSKAKITQAVKGVRRSFLLNQFENASTQMANVLSEAQGLVGFIDEKRKEPLQQIGEGDTAERLDREIEALQQQKAALSDL